jgi:hypothetical protein
MAAVYPTSLKTYTTKTNKVDIVDATHINDIQNEVVALEVNIGTSPGGSFGTLATRLAQMMDTNGSIQGGSAFPGTTYGKQMFYKTDTDNFYIRNAGNTIWNQIGAVLSDLTFDRQFTQGVSVSTSGWVSYNKHYIRKVSGISGLSCKAELTGNGEETVFRFSVNGVYSNTMFQNNLFSTTWMTGTCFLDISSLPNNTFYEVIPQFTHMDTASTMYLLSFMGWAS